MALLTDEPTFDRPIPGQSLTAELGGRPWQSPPQYSNIDEVMDFYMERMSSDACSSINNGNAYATWRQ